MQNPKRWSAAGRPGPETPSRARILAAYPFRAFFVLCAVYAVVGVGLWAAFLAGRWIPPAPDPILWHVHEMLFGVVAAAMAGFLLTAIANWTARPALSGAPLVALAALWLAGRLMMVAQAASTAAAIVDAAFLAVLTLYVARELLLAGNRRNLVLVAVLGVLLVVNIAMHTALMGTVALRGEVMAAGMMAIAVLMVVIGGRITPAFTANWLRMHGGRVEAVRTSALLDWAAILSTAALIPAELAAAGASTAWLALIAALINGLRLARWSGWQVRGEPLLWVLHLGYAWIVAALAIRALSPDPGGLWSHILGVGAAGTLILGVMTRVALGHTGRELRLPPTGTVIYAAITASALLRVAAVPAPPDAVRVLLLAAAAAWVLAFVWFLALFWPVLSQPRVDARPG